MKITVKELKTIIQEELQSVLEENQVQESCGCPDDAHPGQSHEEAEMSEAVVEEENKPKKCDEITPCPAGRECQDGECVSISGLEKDVGPKVDIEEQIIEKVLEALK